MCKESPKMQYLRQCHKPVRACKQPRCIRRDIGPTLEIYVPSGLTIAMVPSLYKNNVHFERKLSRRRAQKCNTCARVKIERTCTGLQTTTLHSAQYRDVNGKMLFFLGYLSPWYRVCTKAMCISKGRDGEGEPKDIILA